MCLGPTIDTGKRHSQPTAKDFFNPNPPVTNIITDSADAASTIVPNPGTAPPPGGTIGDGMTGTASPERPISVDPTKPIKSLDGTSTTIPIPDAAGSLVPLISPSKSGTFALRELLRIGVPDLKITKK